METNSMKTKEEDVDIMSFQKSAKKRKLTPKLFKLNVGGTKYEVSDSLLDQFKDSMLRRITSDTWNGCDDSSNPSQEIFIERDGGRFKFVLDYMRDGKVVLPLSIPRPQIVSDMEYYGIDFDQSQIILGVANPNDTFHQLSEYYFEKERFKKIFESKRKDIETRYRKLAVESVSCAIALNYFEEQFSGKSSFVFEPKKIKIDLGVKDRFYYTIEELQPHLNLYGLFGSGIIQGRKEVVRSDRYDDITRYRKDRPATYIELQVKMLRIE